MCVPLVHVWKLAVNFSGVSSSSCFEAGLWFWSLPCPLDCWDRTQGGRLLRADPSVLKRTDPDGSPFPSILVRRLWQSRKLTPCQVLLKSFSMYLPCVRTLTGAQRSENNLGSWFCLCTRGSRNWTRNVRLPSKPFTHWITLLSQGSLEDKSMNQRNRISITQLCYTTGPSTFEMHERAE